MFRSKGRNLIFPQSEHLRLAGAIAQNWGNRDFELPPIDNHSFVTGIGLHDLGHGYFDQNEVGAMQVPQRVRSMRNMAEAQLTDKSAELILQHHVLRLMGDQAIYDELRPALQQRIDANIAAVGIPHTVFERIDRITNLADMIAFHFCFDHPERVTNSVSVYANAAEVEQAAVTYQIENGIILLDPWPLRVDAVEGYLLAYDADVYPHTLTPHVVPYRIQSA